MILWVLFPSLISWACHPGTPGMCDGDSLTTGWPRAPLTHRPCLWFLEKDGPDCVPGACVVEMEQELGQSILEGGHTCAFPPE